MVEAQEAGIVDTWLINDKPAVWSSASLPLISPNR